MAPPRTSVTNAQVLQAIDALSRQQQQRDEPLEAWQSDVSTTLADVVRRQVALEHMMATALTKETKRDSCPFRDDIVTAANNRNRLKALEDKAHQLEVQMVRAGMYGGAAGSGVIGLITMLAFGVGKMRGWW